jgi:hypothetical protein
MRQTRYAMRLTDFSIADAMEALTLRIHDSAKHP